MKPQGGSQSCHKLKWDRIKALLLRPRSYCGCEVLIEKLEKFTIKNERERVISTSAIDEQSTVLFSIAAHVEEE